MKKTIRDYDLNNKRVIIRVDFNVPIKNGIIEDDTRIIESLETIKYAIENNAKVILLSHLGRVKEESDKEKNTLSPVAKRLSKLLGKLIFFEQPENLEEFSIIEETINRYMQTGDVMLLENTRFFDLDGKLESGCSLELSKKFASLGDIFIDDAFATIHRKHASNVGIASFLPSGIGFLVEKELKELSYLNDPDRPYAVILGGSKVSDKIGVIEELVKKCDYLVIGGAMAFTFLKAQGVNTGKSLVEDNYIDFCKDILKNYSEKIILPVDVVVSKEINESNYQNKLINELDNDDIGLDLGEQTIEYIVKTLSNTKTVMWNGPLGYYELEPYIKATNEILTFLTDSNIKTILGGGDIVNCATKLGLKNKVYHISTGGGATLQYLENKELPGLSVISEGVNSYEKGL